MASAAPTPVEDALPRRFGRYVLFDKIGEGGMARIYLARTSTELGGERLIVVKQILPMLSSSQEFSRLLVDEAKLAAGLMHGNIVQVTDLGREQDTLYIAMEYVEGFDLRDLLRQCSKGKVPLPVEFALLSVIETLRGLDYAHRKKSDDGKPLGIVHRDVSPSNVLVSFDGEVKLCDFGIARAMNAGADLPEEAIQGKAGYMSPEAARGDALDGRADVFAVGVILWELLSGRRLYRGEGGKGPTLDQAKAALVPALPSRGLAEEARLYDIVHRALARDPAARTASAAAMLRELEGYVGAAGMVASPLRFGEWLTAHFAEAILETRRMRQRAAKAVEAGPLVQMSVTRPVAVQDRSGSGYMAPAIVTSGIEAGAEVSTVEVESAPASIGPIVRGDESDALAPPAESGGLPGWSYYVIGVVVLAAIVAGLLLR